MQTMVDMLKEILTPDEVVLLDKAIKKVETEHKKKSVSKQLRKVVPVSEWINSEYYAGPDVDRIYPYWKNAIIEICESKTPINEVILSGAIGTGKSTTALYLITRRLYELSCYENIPARFALMSSSLVSFLYFSLSKTQAELTGFGQLKNLIDSIPYFQEYFARNKGINSLIVWPDENLLITYGSEPSHMIGMNMMGSILDEANFFSNDPQNPNKAVSMSTEKMARMYSSIINRAKSRFIVGGVDYSLSILVSSATTAASFTEKRISESIGKSNVKIYAPALWDVKPKGTYSEQYFYVFQGDEVVDPFIVTCLADVQAFLEAKGLKKSDSSIDEIIESLPYQYKTLFIKVPEDFRNSFEINIIQSLQDIAGRSVSPTGKLFTSKTAFNKCIVNDMRHPFTKEQFMISTGDSIQVKDFLIPGFHFKDPKKPHYIHIDQSVTTDYTGFAAAYPDRYLWDEETQTKKMVVRLDLMMDIIPPAPPRQISISKVHNFVFYLKSVMGVNIARVTYDSFASNEARQVLNDAGVKAEYLSVDRTDEQYLAVVNLMLEGRLEFYENGVFRKEWFDLIWYRVKRKVDHPGDTASGGTKDLCDAIVGAVWGALQADVLDVEENEDTKLFISANKKSETEEDIFYKSLFEDYSF